MKKSARSLFITLILVICSASFSFSQDSSQVKKKLWFENISIKGYMQVRYNRLLETNPKLKCESCDRSWGENGGFYIRRGRLVFSGNIHPRVFFYIQPDFAQSVSPGAQQFLQLRDAYLDVSVDKKNEFRFRFGQSKVPFGYDNMQSSQDRFAFDRSDALNSAAPNERDLGVTFYWTPKKIRDLYAQIKHDGLKGSGDYGMLALGLYNGQSSNRPELNNSPHAVVRFSYPFQFGKQITEIGIQAYRGKYFVNTDQRSATVKGLPDWNYLDERAGLSAVLLPQPLGIQAEYNIGKGPQYNPVTDSIEVKNLNGGYVTLSYMQHIKGMIFSPFVRLQQYKGGKKHELDARSYDIKEMEIGLEWQALKNVEFTLAYTISQRRFEDHVLQSNLQKGNLLRLQTQLSF